MFFGLYAGPLTRFARGWLSPQDAEEVVDDVLLEAAASAEEYDPSRTQHSGLSVWLLVRCRSRAIDRIRRSRRHGQASTTLEQGEHASEAATLVGSDDPQREVEARWELRAFWASLSEKEREVVALHHFYGLPYDAIALRMHVRLSTIHEYAKRARAKLKKRV